ncbi:hypothetical protein [Cryptosporidium hominis TU502]|uniref:hypothetical protein n=1 Tax=Cryptosporidium hominis (strain TU502) TaxID=353151 RepID=UPI0000452D4A|nr:hypothetical protein [Cryptosporidium hominis TU502]
MSMLDACYIVYNLRDGYFSGCSVALELTIKENEKIKDNSLEICKEVLKIAKEDPEIKDLVHEAHPNDISNILEKIEFAVKMGMDEQPGGPPPSLPPSLPGPCTSVSSPPSLPLFPPLPPSLRLYACRVPRLVCGGVMGFFSRPLPRLPVRGVRVRGVPGCAPAFVAWVPLWFAASPRACTLGSASSGRGRRALARRRRGCVLLADLTRGGPVVSALDAFSPPAPTPTLLAKSSPDPAPFMVPPRPRRRRVLHCEPRPRLVPWRAVAKMGVSWGLVGASRRSGVSCVRSRLCLRRPALWGYGRRCC